MQTIPQTHLQGIYATLCLKFSLTNIPHSKYVSKMTGTDQCVYTVTAPLQGVRSSNISSPPLITDFFQEDPAKELGRNTGVNLSLDDST